MKDTGGGREMGGDREQGHGHLGCVRGSLGVS